MPVTKCTCGGPVSGYGYCELSSKPWPECTIRKDRPLEPQITCNCGSPLTFSGYCIRSQEYWTKCGLDKLTTTDSILQERGKTHGDFKENSEISQDIKIDMLGSSNWTKLTPSQRESLHMIAHKIGRILSGDHNYKDHWDDIAGYATLISKQINGNPS